MVTPYDSCQAGGGQRPFGVIGQTFPPFLISHVRCRCSKAKVLWLLQHTECAGYSEELDPKGRK
jgi:hypothetical protein